MALTPAQAKVADEALAAVARAVEQARDAIDSESSALIWLTGSESAHAARLESLRQTEKIAAELARRRPGLQASGLVSFVELAAAGAEVGAILADARRVTGAGFLDEVVTPTIDELNPNNLGGLVGKTIVLVAALALFLILTNRRS